MCRNWYRIISSLVHTLRSSRQCTDTSSCFSGIKHVSFFRKKHFFTQILVYNIYIYTKRFEQIVHFTLTTLYMSYDMSTLNWLFWVSLIPTGREAVLESESQTQTLVLYSQSSNVQQHVNNVVPSMFISYVWHCLFYKSALVSRIIFANCTQLVLSTQNF